MSRIIPALILISAFGPMSLLHGQSKAEQARTALGISFTNPDLNVDALRSLPVLEDRRFKPLDSLARERVRSITLDVKFLRQDPLLLYLFLAFEPERARKARIIHVPTAHVAEKLGYTFEHKDDSWTTWEEIRDNAKFQELFETAADKDPKKRNKRDNEVLSFYTRWHMLADLGGFHGGRPHMETVAFPAFPPAIGKQAGQTYTFFGPEDLEHALSGSDNGTEGGELLERIGWPAPVVTRLSEGFASLRSAYLAGEQSSFDEAVRGLRQSITALEPPDYPDGASMEREVAFNKTNPFSHARWLYIGASFLSLFMLLLGFAVKASWLRVAKVFVPMGLVCWGLWLHIGGLVERTLLSDRAMIGNFFDSMVFVAGACAMIGVVIEIFMRKGWLIFTGSALGWIALSVAISNPGTLDPKIQPLVPVLINNYWIHIHVPTMMCSYAALGLTALLGTAYVFGYLIFPPESQGLRDIVRTMGITMPVGVILLFVGMVLGGVWADASWGRFWGFDPKETWSLITWLVFMVLIHGHWAGWLRDFGGAMGAKIGGWSLLWTYWGANFYQSGLHSYAGSDPDRIIPAWLWMFAGGEGLLMGAGILVWTIRSKRKAVPAAAQPQTQEPGQAG